MTEVDTTAPTEWGGDLLSDFLEQANQNAFAVFANHREVFTALSEIGEFFLEAREIIPSDSWLAAVFLLRSHASYLGAARLGVSGQAPETYMVLRSCLESALYAYHIEKDPARAATWLNRHDNPDSRKAAKTEFSYSRCLRSLKQGNMALSHRIGHLYEHTIDHGAHPNERAILPHLTVDQRERSLTITLKFMNPGSGSHAICLGTVVDVGIASLEVFQAVALEQFEATSFPRRLQEIRAAIGGLAEKMSSSPPSGD